MAIKHKLGICVRYLGMILDINKVVKTAFIYKLKS